MKHSVPYLTTLTPLRGIAALLVVIYHSDLMLAPFVDHSQTGFMKSGWLWVDFFFVLSGFVLTHAYGGHFREKVTWAGYRKYMLARFARVYPLHFLTLLAAVGVTVMVRAQADGMDPFLGAIFDLKAIPVSLVLAQSLHTCITAPLNTPSWSLSTEWWVYMVFPLLVGPFSRLRGIGRLGALIGIAGLFLGVMYYLVPNYSDNGFVKPGQYTPPTLNTLTDWGLVRCLAGFLLGMLFHELYRHGIGYRLLRSGWAFLASFVGVLAAMHFAIHDLLIVCFFPFIILTAAWNEDFIKRVLETRPLQRLGDWSFSIYMVHIPIAFFLTAVFILPNHPKMYSSFPAWMSTPFPPGGPVCLVLLVLTLGTAALTYRYVEVPARNYINRRFGHRRQAYPVNASVSEVTL
ncbi:acyltransferase family protein [Larkinella soli]|uniref:acyltransferase family protein n=1 Tax=Larkinella soli TaxID=1770527 RepID=UPI000FFB99E1|nr:acyltransferase [Larkinella soli]